MTATTAAPSESIRYLKCIEASKRIRWEIERDVFRGRTLDFGKRFLPDRLSKVNELEFLTGAEQTFLSQVQGRTYANVFGLSERFIGAKVIELSGDHALGDQVALEAMVRFADEELKHQELFRQLEVMTARGMPSGYAFEHDADAVARSVLSASNWAVLGLTFDIEVFTQVHYRNSIEPSQDLCPLWKDVFLFHWREEAQHAVIDELEWRRTDRQLLPAERDRGVDDLIGLVGAVDGILQLQAKADADYFLQHTQRLTVHPDWQQRVRSTLLAAYRWQFIGSGAQEPRFLDVLGELITPAQGARIQAALAPLVG